MSDNKTFLATTALDSFWDLEAKKIIFLGEWCKLYTKQNRNRDINSETLEYIWKDENEIDTSIEYVDNVYNIVIEKLTKKLTKSLQVKKDKDAWNILLKPWLSIYIQVFYDRYRHIKLAHEQYDNLYTYTLCEEDYEVVSTPSAFSVNISTNDAYNLQLYSQIVKFLGLECVDKSNSINLKNNDIKYNSNIKNTVVKNVSKIMNKIFNKKSILIVSPYFKNNTLKKYINLSLKSRFLFVFDNLQYKVSVNKSENLHLRKKLFDERFDDEFIGCAFNSLVYNLPQIYLENYNEFSQKVSLLGIGKYSAIYSSNALYGNEIFKFFSLDAYKDSNIFYGQHGGNYGIDKKHVLERIEKSFADQYFTLGWTDANEKVLPTIVSESKKSVSENINFIMTSMPRYFYRFVYQEDSTKMLSYIENSATFLKQLKEVEKITVRLYMHDYMWNVKERLKDSLSVLKFDNEKDYYSQITSAKLNIFDHMHTGYLETMSINKPTIVLIDKESYAFRDESIEYIDMLKRTNILFDDPFLASEFINDLDIDQWWNSKEVQEVKDVFCYRYNRSSLNWEQEWIDELSKAIAKNNEREISVK